MKIAPVQLLGILIFTATNLVGQENLPEEKLEFFENHIRPALIKYCYECHSEESGKTKGGLLLDTREGMLNGGTSGDLMTATDEYNSLFVDAITWADSDYEMPPKEKMPADVIEKLKEWMAMGAPDPRLRQAIIVESSIDIEAGKEHWAFQKPVRPDGTSIDDFVEATLAEKNLKPTGAADALTLLRRLSFDLNGLPPTPGEIRVFTTAWEKDKAAAVKAKVDELLAKPQFGERWGRHWLDVARYAESSGNTNFTFPHAWRYRNYVIDSFNDDKPYDRFIKEQIAGDLLPAKDDDQWQEQLIATGFLALGIKSLNDRNPRTFQMDLIDEQIDTTTRAILGITVSCARCHDHKFDPIPTTDYYALAGIFMSTNTYYGTISGLQNHQPSELIELPNQETSELSLNFTEEEVAAMRKKVTDLTSEMRSIRQAAQNGGEKPEQRQMVAMRNQIGQLEGALGTLNEDGTSKTFGMGVQDADEIINANVLQRGDVEKQGQEIERGFLQVLQNGDSPAIKENQSGRLQLADWLVSEQNPLTARVMINRIWMHLLGSPIVDSPNNWGLKGQQPTHGELLDFMAIRFMENDWSIKSAIHAIVLSDTYQRDSTFDSGNYEIDPDNTWLWRASPRQLDAESLRDSLLAMSGNLDKGRPSASPVMKIGDARVGRQIDPETFYQSNHRSVYLPVIRDAVSESLALFNFADPNETKAKREVTNVSSQALFLMNNEFVTTQAQSMATWLWDRFDSNSDRVKGAFLLAYGRPATSDEQDASREFFTQFKIDPEAKAPKPKSDASSGRKGKGKGKGKGTSRQPEVETKTEPVEPLTPEQEVLAMFCQGLMASAEFRILN